MKSFINYAKNRFLYNLLRFTIVFVLGLIASQFLFIPNVYADTVTQYYIQDTNSTKETYWYANDFYIYPNQYIIFANDNERYVTLSTCLTGNLDFQVTGLIDGNIEYFDTFSGASCDVRGYKGAMYYYIFYVNEFHDAGNGNFSVYFNLKVSNLNNYRVEQDIFNVSSSSKRPTLDNYDQVLNDINGSLGNINDNISDTNEKLDEAEKTRKGILATIKDLPNQILNMLKGLFIPEDGFFEEWFEDFMSYVEIKLGFLATPFTIFIDFIESYLDLDSSSDVIINIPDITVPNFENHIIIRATSFNWSETLRSKDSFNILWQLYLDFIDVFLILNFIGLCENVYNRIFGGNTSNYEYYTVEDSYTYDNETGEVLSSRRNERTTTRKKVDNK